MEDNAVQVRWRRGPDGRPGVADFTGLRPGRRHVLRVTALGGRRVLARTLPTPPGVELSRFATINDVHIGCTYFGLLHAMHEPAHAVPHAVRCLQSAVADAIAWGAELLVVKGDLTHMSRPGEWATVGEVLGNLRVPVVVVPGNHEVKPGRPSEPQPGLARHGLHLVHGVEVIDLRGVRLILVDSTVAERDHGRIAHVADDIARRAERAPDSVVVGMHHNLQRHHVRTLWPPGVPGAESAEFLRKLHAANPRSLVTTGHTHRHRRAVQEGVTVTEVGSTKDYPGTWTGYVVHEGGLRQVVRKVSEPSILPWTEHTRWAVGGLWGLYSPGRLRDRCFSVAW
ncbi:MAG: metallophosphoesterase [Acidimicrobiales bacterium]